MRFFAYAALIAFTSASRILTDYDDLGAGSPIHFIQTASMVNDDGQGRAPAGQRSIAPGKAKPAKKSPGQAAEIDADTLAQTRARSKTHRAHVAAVLSKKHKK